MYNKWFFITTQVWNNALWYKKRENKKIYVPSLVEENIHNIELQNDKEKIAFEDFWFDWKLSTNYWLKNFYRLKWKNKEIILFDNHNHAFYFWYEARKNGSIWDNNVLIHIDEHADTRDPEEYLLKPDSFDLGKIFKFTNDVLNVWNYIIPAVREGIIWEVIQIRNETNLNNYLNNNNLGILSSNKNIILNLDLDFFQSDLDYIDYRLKKKVVLDAANKAKIITVSTSPFFINQKTAIKIFKDIFNT